VIGWITGLFGAATGGTEQLQIMPDSYISNSSQTLYLHVVNRGGDVTIYKIETCRETQNTEIVVDAGSDTTLQITLSEKYAPGTLCDVKVYTKAGNVFTAQVTVKQ